MGRLAVMAHFDPRGQVASHVRRQVEALAGAFDDLVIVSTANLADSHREWLSKFGRVIARTNVGYDFFSYKAGLESVKDLQKYDEVVTCNDTYVGPLVPYTEVCAAMSGREVDFWGLTSSERIAPHVQSFFVAFRPWVVGSRAFERFWDQMLPVSDRRRVIHRYEIGLSEGLTSAGFRYDAYFAEGASDRRLARRRVVWWTAHRAPLPRTTQERSWFATEGRAAWNPAIALADAALDGGRMPYVKVDTLRYDPYALNSSKLLELCEKRHPEAFEGVRGYLADTARFYPPRPEGGLLPTPHLIAPMRRLVEYGCAA